MFSRSAAVVLAFLLFSSYVLATVFSTVRGIVHDPQHRPVSSAQVVLKAKASDYTQTSTTSDEGDFHFDSVPVGDYTVTVSGTGFNTIEQSITVLSGTAPILHFELTLATQAQTVTVTTDSLPAQTESVTPTTLVSRQEIADTPGASLSNSLAMITDYVPGAY